MKKFYAILCLAIASLTQLQAQAPQGFNYQATVRNSSGDLIVNTNVYFKFNVIQGSQTAVPIFTETHYVPTDDLGQVNLVIGQGTANTGVFSELDWSLGSYYLGIELDTGNGYVAMGTTQLLSVPYALYAESSGSSSSGFPTGGTEGQVLSIVSGVPTWTDVSGSTNSEDLAEITTVEASNIDFESMISGGNINNDGGFTVVSKGVIWSESPDPTPELETKTDEGGGASSFTSTITGLDEETEYFYRAYATTSAGTAYGSTYSFTTDSSQFYDQDGDGFTPDQGDCNDSDPSIYPGATEIEDGIDNDCDGNVDEDLCGNGILDSGEACDDGGLNDPASNCYECQIYEDADNDGFNSYFDCNDSDASTYPGATEIYDGIDNDCNGAADDCPIEADFAIGDFTLTTVATGINGSVVLVNGTVTITEGETPTDRVISVATYPEFGDFPAIDFQFSLVCGNVVVPSGQTTGVGCGSSTTLGPATELGTYNPSDDSSFNIIFTDDEGGASCGTEYAAEITLTKAVDNDNDGYYINVDCDDTNAQINPGATEIEDGIDNNCDGEIDEGFESAAISGTWRLAPEAGAIGVGPALNDISWWSNSSDDVTIRACLFDDTYVFGSDGSFQNVLGAETWIESWQGTVAGEECGTPVAPHDGSAAATYTYNQAAGTITLNGVGAYLGLARVMNGVELASPADAPDSITYMATLSEDGNTLELDIEVVYGSSGYWSFKLVKD